MTSLEIWFSKFHLYRSSKMIDRHKDHFFDSQEQSLENFREAIEIFG